MKSLIETLKKLTASTDCDTCKKAIQSLERISKTKTVNGIAEFKLTIHRQHKQPTEIHIERA